MLRARVIAVAVSLAPACTQVHSFDSGPDGASSGTDANNPLDAVPGSDAVLPVLEACSISSLETIEHELVDVRHTLCQDPIYDIEPLPDGLPWYYIEAFVPLGITEEGDALVLEGLLAHRPNDAGDIECRDHACAYLLGFRVRYRIRFEGAAPFAALEEAIAIDRGRG